MGDQRRHPERKQAGGHHRPKRNGKLSGHIDPPGQEKANAVPAEYDR
jgi:hypothetical protein